MKNLLIFFKRKSIIYSIHIEFNKTNLKLAVSKNRKHDFNIACIDSN